MRIENKLFILELDIIRCQILTLVDLLNVERQCFEVLRRIQFSKGLLNSITAKMINQQLNKSISIIESQPSLSEYENQMNCLLDLFRTVNASPIYFQLSLDEVVHE